jgi:selenocysteine-specific elongation factor
MADPAEAFAALLATSPFASDLAVFVRDRALSAEETERLVADLQPILLDAGTSRIAVAAERWPVFTASLLEQLAAYHMENPDLPGIGREHLRRLLAPALPAATFAIALQRLARMNELVLDGGFVRLAAHEVRLAPNDEELWDEIAAQLGGAERFRPPRVRDIAERLARPERDIRRLLKLVGRMGLANEVAHDHFFLRATVREMAMIIADVASHAEEGSFAAAAFRDRVDNGRKVAIQILDFFDRHGVTLRQGDLRRLDKRRLDLF